MKSIADSECEDAEILSALDEIIEGRFVKRSVHELIHEGRDVTSLFIERLMVHEFAEKRVREVDLQVEERVPAFAIRDRKAYFGWIFIERFTETKSRKLFGSSARNTKGDWLIQVSQNSNEAIYVNCRSKFGMEEGHLFVME